MSVIAPRFVVPAPAITPRPYSLLTAATVLPFEDIHERNGVTWEPAVCDPAAAWAVVCPADAATKDDGKWDGPAVEAEPFVVYAQAECSTISQHSVDDARDRARRNLVLGEAYVVERAFMEGTFGQTPSLQDATDVTPATGALNPVAALSTLEAYLAENYLGTGVIHASPAAVPFLAQANLLTPAGVGWQTHLGTRVAVGAGYTANVGPAGTVAPAGEAWLYATGQVVIRRSDIEVIPTEGHEVNFRTNTLDVIAERTYVLGYECAAFAVRMELSCPA